MDKILHPYRMTLEEVDQLLKIVGNGRLFIDLFGGSGIVSIRARKVFDEVIYNDIRRDKFVDVKMFKELGIESFKDDFSEVLSFADKKTVVFADPPFYKLSNFDNWTIKDHIRLLQALEDSDAIVFMLDSKHIMELIPKYGRSLKILMDWKFRQDDVELKNNVVLLTNQNFDNQRIVVRHISKPSPLPTLRS